ncbi:MAG: hypothetical protein R3F61_26325 [Myxococcota bacterium]
MHPSSPTPGRPDFNRSTDAGFRQAGGRHAPAGEPSWWDDTGSLAPTTATPAPHERVHPTPPPAPRLPEHMAQREHARRLATTGLLVASVAFGLAILATLLFI